MTRALTGAFNDAKDAEHIEAAHLIDLAFDGGTVRITDCGHDVIWDGNTYIGAGSVIGMDAFRETTTNEVLAVKLTIAGPVSAYRSIALAEHSHGRLCTIRIALFTDGVVIADPSVEHIGRLGAISMVDEAADDGDVRSLISVSSESKHAGARKPKNRRHSLEDHQTSYPTDTIHRFMPSLAQKSIVWPSKRYFEK